MSADYVFIKSGTASPVVPGEFTNGDGTPLNLTDKDVYFTMRPWDDSNYIVNHQPATVNGDPSGGNVYYGLSTDEAVEGHHLGEWNVQPDNLTLPVDGYVHILIAPSL